jgi:hypothetical protein
MAAERKTEGAFLRFVRGCIYNRWFYAFLAAVCLLDVTADTWAMIHPRRSFPIEAVSLVASGLTAVLTVTVFLDLQFRRRKP